MTVVLMAQNQLIDKNILYKRLENFQRKYLIAKFMQGIKASIRASGKQKQRNRMLVYGGGALVAFCLDVEIRSANNNTKGVYDLMREMYRQFGETGKRYTLADVVKIANKLAGKDLSNGKKIKYLFGGRDLLLRSGIFCVRSSATGNKNNETSVTKVIS